MKGLVITILALGFYHCSSQDLNSSITLSIKVDKEYTLTKTKDFHARTIRENGYVVNSDSVKQNYYDINIEIKNISDRPISLWLMKCSYTDNFLVNNNYISFRGHECDGNYPIQVKLKPRESKIYETTLVKSIKFDYPCQHCVYGRQVETTKLGLIVIDDIFESKINALDYDLGMDDKSKWRIVWSNSLQLLGKQPEPKTIIKE